MIEVEGTVEKTRWRSDESGWTIVAAHVEGEGQTVVVGELAAELGEGECFTARGQWMTHAKFGRQFKFDALTVLPPSGRKQVIARLVTYPKIGKKTAERIADHFGPDTWEVMSTEIHRLAEVKTEKGRRAVNVSALLKIEAHHALQNGPVAKVANRLIELGASATMAKRIFEVFGDESLDTLERHPFKICPKVERFGFTTADRISRSAGLDPTADERIDAGIIHAINERMMREGHCGLPHRELTGAAVKLLRVREDIVAAGLDRGLTAGVLNLQRGEGESLVFTSGMSWTETSISHSIGKISTAPRAVLDVGDLPEELSDGQRRAVHAVAESRLAIITGGPGTGKSTVVANVLKVAERAGLEIILCAPTGRAAKRLTETTGHEASTVHRLLRWQPPGGFSHDQQNPLPPGLIVIDEASMLDARLAESLLLALTPQHRVLIVGDADQLPSVGPGNVIKDIIDAAESEGSIIPVVRLREVFRQAAGSMIIKNAHRILAGEPRPGPWLAPVYLESDPPKKADGELGEFFVLPVQDTLDDRGDIIRTAAAAAHDKIVRMATKRIPAAYGLDPLTDVQVLCPMHKGDAGTGKINQTLQRIYTARGQGFARSEHKDAKRFFVGDRVMQTRNDYDRNVFNGDIGTVVKINPHALTIDVDGPTMTVDFDGTIAEYGLGDIGPVQLAYAMSIHKSQGSEFPAVLIPIMSYHSIMLRLNLIYTAMTRAKRLCVIVGEERAIRKAIETADAAKRWTGLGRRVLEALGRGNSQAPRALSAS